jgi:hypothetical protein
MVRIPIVKAQARVLPNVATPTISAEEVQVRRERLEQVRMQRGFGVIVVYIKAPANASGANVDHSKLWRRTWTDMSTDVGCLEMFHEGIDKATNPELRKLEGLKRLSRAGFSGIRRGIDKYEELCRALRKTLRVGNMESEPYDMILPFGDEREWICRAVWLFDIENDLLTHYDNTYRRCALLSDLLSGELRSMDQFEIVGPTVPVYEQMAFSEPTWDPVPIVDERLRPISHRLITDFAYQWRHILRQSYNDHTLKKIARAVTSLAQLQFTCSGEYPLKPHVNNTTIAPSDAPQWQGYNLPTIPFENGFLIIQTDILKGLDRVKNHRHLGHSPAVLKKDQVHYMLFSARHIILCTIVEDNQLFYTQPVEFLTGLDSPSTLALDIFLYGISSISSKTKLNTKTRLHNLPLELQDLVLDHIQPPLERAQVGYLIDLGSTFKWREQGVEIELAQKPLPWSRTDPNPKRTELFLDDDKLGLGYRVAREEVESFGLG